MKNTKIVNRVESNNTRLRKDKAKNFIDTALIKLKSKYKFYSRLLTCVHNPNNISEVEAWENIYFDLDKIKKILKNKEYNILFSIIVVEVHEGKNKKKEKKVEEIETIKLEGYPHIHAVIFFISPDGKIIDMSKIVKDIRENTSFSSGDDIKIDGGERKAGKQIVKNDENFVCYVIKNANHKKPFEIMSYIRNIHKEKITEDVGTENCFLIDNSDDKDVIDFVKGIAERGILIHISEEKRMVNEVKKDETYVEHIDNAAKIITKKEEGFKITLAAVIYYMNQENLKLYKEKVFQKVEGSRRTWEYWGTMDKIFGCLFEPSNENIILPLLENKGKVIEISVAEDQKFLPHIDINWFFVEFKDFYLHLPSYIIVKGELPNNVVCGFMNESLGLKDLNNMKNPERWLTGILNQPFAQDKEQLEDFFYHYYAITLPLIQKAKVMCLYGPPNTSKSSVMEPINKFFPKELKTQTTEGRFANSDIYGKKLLPLDDVKPKALGAANVLQLFEGGKDIMFEKKRKDAFHEKFEGNIYICTNEFPEDWMMYDEKLMEYILKEQYETRLAIFRFETKVNKPKPGFMKILTSEEIGKIILFTGNYYAKKFLERDCGVLICDTYEECKGMLRDHEAIFEFQTR